MLSDAIFVYPLVTLIAIVMTGFMATVIYALVAKDPVPVEIYSTVLLGATLGFGVIGYFVELIFGKG